MLSVIGIVIVGLNRQPDKMGNHLERASVKDYQDSGG